mmetsp:Transcript_13711/g.27545  ORF Transcript_13711/g.27545 Transcript_13711/m.27545 type:complete len:239 (+) Transcript_13711:929-1645(+)
MQQEDGKLQLETGIDDGFRNLGDGTGNQQTGRDNAHHGRDGKNGLDEFWEQLIGSHTNGDGSQDNLNGRLGNTDSIHRHDGSEEALTQKRRHDNGTDGCGRCHEDRQSHVSTGNISAKIGSLSTVDASYQHHTGSESRIQTKDRTQQQGQGGHHGIALQKLHQGWDGFLGNLYKVIGRQRDTHGKHERGESSREVFRRKPGKIRGFLQSPKGEEDRPERKQSSGDICRPCVRIKDFLS